VLSKEILRLFTDINRRGTTVLVATHEPSIIDSDGGRILSLDGGRLVEEPS
jgi:cell division transport system ATP-binding protein